MIITPTPFGSPCIAFFLFSFRNVFYTGHMSDYVSSKALMFHGDDTLPSTILASKIGKCASSGSTTTHTATSSIAAGDSDQDPDAN